MTKDPVIAKLCPDVTGGRGAPMGRPHTGVYQYAQRGPFYLREIKLDKGGYDPGGAYWGARPKGCKLYGALSEDGNAQTYVDAEDRTHAKELVRRRFPAALFKGR